MKRYTIAVRRWWVVPGALIALVVVCGTAGTSTVPVPSLTGSVGGAQLTYFTPVLVIVAVMYCMERRLHQAESTAVVPLPLLDRAALVLTVVLAHAAGLVVGMDVARNIMLLLALAIATRRLANEATAAAAGLLLLILNLILGRAYDGAGHAAHTWWALTLYPADSGGAWLFTALLFALALKLADAGQRT
jgi:hypothetical protein